MESTVVGLKPTKVILSFPADLYTKINVSIPLEYDGLVIDIETVRVSFAFKSNDAGLTKLVQDEL